MRIVVPILGFGASGGYRVISELASRWTMMGNAVEILVHEASHPPYFPTRSAIRWIDDEGNPVNGSSAERYRERRGAVGVFKNLRSLYRGLNKTAKADVVLANHSLTAWPVWLSNNLARKYYYIQAYEPEYYACSPTGRKMRLFLLSWLTYYFPLSRIVNSPIYFKYKNLSADTFVPPGIDLNLFTPANVKENSTGRPFRIGCIGRREPEKGTAFVLEAHRLLVQSGFSSELRVAFGNLPEFASKCRNVTVILPKGDAELADFYRSVDALVAPGLAQHGAAHYPVLEAMACGVPVVTTGYMPANNRNSWIVPVGRADAIAERIRSIARDPENAATRVKQALADVRPFAWENVSAEMLGKLALPGRNPSH